MTMILIFRSIYETDEDLRERDRKLTITVAIIMIIIAVPMSNRLLWAIVQGLLLFLGFTNSTIGMALLLFDGYFHFRMGLGDNPNSPDWIISRRLFGFRGMPHWVHNVMGAALVLIVVSKFMGDRGKWGKLGELGKKVYDIVYPIAAVMILISIIIKASPTAIPNNVAKFLNIPK